jgi:hypothetical protein
VLLGDIMSQLEEEAFAAEAVLGLAGLGLLVRLQERADASGLSLGGYAAWAARTYADNASADEWTTLIGILGKADDPGSAFLRRTLTCALAAEPRDPSPSEGRSSRHPMGRSC